MRVVLLAGVGLAAGVINVVAGGGSFLTLPILVFVGLPVGVANGTNRVALLLQNIGAVSAFNRHGVLEWRFASRVAPAAVIAAGLGAWVATMTGDLAFRRILASLMLATALWTLARPTTRMGLATGSRSPLSGTGLTLMFIAIGFYGGFIQAGVGFLLIAGASLGGLDLVRGNALKVLLVLIWTVVTVAVFGAAGMIDWVAGVAMGVGNLAGSQLGVHLTVRKGSAWVRGFVTVCIVVFAIRLWFFG